jgi:hypothetical protein
MSSSPRLAPWIVSALLLAACREGTESQGGDFIPVMPSPFGTQGCGPGAPVPGAIVPVFTDAVIGPLSQIAAAAGTETLYLTGEDATVVQLDFPLGGGLPVSTTLVAAGVVDGVLALAPGTAQLSGITVFDNQFLVVAEHTTNTLLSVRRDLGTVQPLAGLPLPAGGFADGEGGSIRFHFTAPVALFADAIGVAFVGDTENHALRQVEIGGLPVASTITGTGAPGDAFGLLSITELNTPSGLASTCSGELLVLESGGNRLLSLAIGGPSLFGGFEGTSLVLAGDGTDATTQGVGNAAQLGTPKGLVSTEDGLLFWVDAKEGVLRRFDFSTGLCDCPLFADCAAAVAGGGSFDGAGFSLALGDSGAIYVLEADQETLHRVDP